MEHLAALSFVDELNGVDRDRSADFNELRDVEAALHQFDLRDKRLPLANATAEFSLGYPGFSPCLDEPFDDALVEVGSKGGQFVAPTEWSAGLRVVGRRQRERGYLDSVFPRETSGVLFDASILRGFARAVTHTFSKIHNPQLPDFHLTAHDEGSEDKIDTLKDTSRNAV